MLEKQINLVLDSTNTEVLFGGHPHLVKTAGRLHPVVEEFIHKYIKPHPRYLYVLVNALGASEYYGSNSRGDYYPEEAISHVPSGWDSLPLDPQRRRLVAEQYLKNPAQFGDKYPYGLATFYTAHVYMHHDNKDPSKAFGTFVLAVYNQEMHRVELVQQIDRERADKLGAGHIVHKIDSGEYPPLSIGCRVPFDECSICGNKAPTRAHYCEHAKFHLNEVLPDGRKVYVINRYPRFFEESWVTIPADKTSFMMMKVASELDELVHRPNMPKQASQQKLADIIKQIPNDSAWARAIKLLQEREDDLPPEVLDEMAKRPELEGNALRAGIVLKPHEFQRMILIRIGKPSLATRLWIQRSCFLPHRQTLPYELPLSEEPGMFSDFMEPRSFYGPFIMRRMMLLRSALGPGPCRRFADPLLMRIGALYNGYRASVLERLLGLSVPRGIISYPPLLPPEIVEGHLLPLLYIRSLI